MANQKTLLDQWSIRDLDNNSELKITVENCTELGNQSLPGIQVFFMGRFVNFEPHQTELWAYQAEKQGTEKLLLADSSWMPDENQFIKVYLVKGEPLKVLIEAKTKTSGTVAKEYNLPF